MKPLPALVFAVLLGPAAPWLASAQTSPAAVVKIQRITWLSADPAPTIDSRPGTGLANKMVAFMQVNWPEVEHVLLSANAKRSWQLLANGDEVCHASSVRTPEREKIAYFTTTQLVPPLQLIVRRDRLAQLPRNAGGEVDLARVLADGRLRGAIVDGRSYGPFIDKLLSQRNANPSLTLYAASDFGSKILPMLTIGRADYSIEHAMALTLGRDPTVRTAQLAAQPIQGASDLTPAGVACPRNAWGLAAVTRIDQVLGTPAGATMLRESFERWITPELRTHYGPRIEQFYKDRGKPSVIR